MTRAEMHPGAEIQTIRVVPLAERSRDRSIPSNDSHLVNTTQGIIAVIDGGQSERGKELADSVRDLLAEEYASILQFDNPLNKLREGLSHANTFVERQGLEASVSVAHVRKKRGRWYLYAESVGDTRIVIWRKGNPFLLRGGHLEQITLDDLAIYNGKPEKIKIATQKKFSNTVALSNLTPQERSDWDNRFALSRSLGKSADLEFNEATKVELKKGDLLIVGSRGFFLNATYEDIEDALRHAKNDMNAAQRLMEKAVSRRGGTGPNEHKKDDDITVLVTSILPSPTQATAPIVAPPTATDQEGQEQTIATTAAIAVGGIRRRRFLTGVAVGFGAAATGTAVGAFAPQPVVDGLGSAAQGVGSTAKGVSDGVGSAAKEVTDKVGAAGESVKDGVGNLLQRKGEEAKASPQQSPSKPPPEGAGSPSLPEGWIPTEKYGIFVPTDRGIPDGLDALFLNATEFNDTLLTRETRERLAKNKTRIVAVGLTYSPNDYIAKTIMALRMFRAGELIKFNEKKNPRLGFGSNLSDRNFLVVDADHCIDRINSYPTNLLRDMVSKNGGIDRFCTAIWIEDPTNPQPRGLTDRKLKEVLEKRLGTP